MDDEVGAELERALQVRREEGVVDRHQDAAPVRELGHRRDVGDLHHRVGGGLEEDQARLRSERARHRVEVAGVDPGDAQPVALEHLLEEPVGAAVDGARRDHVVVRLAPSS